MAAHVANCSPGVRNVLKSLWEVEAMSPGVADHITLGITAGAGLVAVRVAVAGGGALHCPQPKSSSRVQKHKEFLMFSEVWASATICYYLLLRATTQSSSRTGNASTETVRQHTDR